MRKLGFVLPVLFLAACGTAPQQPRTVAAPSVGGPIRGIDMGMDSRDVTQELKGSGLHFVARYYRSPVSRWPALTAEEAGSISSNGMKVVAVWQHLSHRPDHFTYERGHSDAVNAYQQARVLGQPSGSAIYFAVDYDAPARDIAGVVQQYFRGVHAGLAAAGGGSPPYRVGVYGSGAVCRYLKRIGLAEYAWLSASTAWYGSRDFTDWNIKQGLRSSMVSFNHGLNEARGDYGGFTVPARYSSL
ncbi:MAG: glycoside hydrolase domain-containing protein [Alphaproteobacteria bacterium]